MKTKTSENRVTFVILSRFSGVSRRIPPEVSEFLDQNNTEAEGLQVRAQQRQLSCLVSLSKNKIVLGVQL